MIHEYIYELKDCVELNWKNIREILCISTEVRVLKITRSSKKKKKNGKWKIKVK